MIESKLMMCAEAVIRDAETNAISIFNVLEELKTTKFPFLIPRFSIYNFLERGEGDEADFNLEVIIRNDEKNLLTHNAKASFEGRLRTRSIIKIHGLLVTDAGTLTVALKVNGREVSQYAIFVKQKTPPQGAPS